jgi:hypothetical protein
MVEASRSLIEGIAIAPLREFMSMYLHLNNFYIKYVIWCTSGFESIATKYDGFILDQYGVMHNGAVALPGT